MVRCRGTGKTQYCTEHAGTREVRSWYWARFAWPERQKFYSLSANAAAVRAIRLARRLLNALHGEAGARKKICAGRGRSATPGFPVSVRRWKALRGCAQQRYDAIPDCRRLCNAQPSNDE